jgi:hypothetical protein
MGPCTSELKESPHLLMVAGWKSKCLQSHTESWTTCISKKHPIVSGVMHVSTSKDMLIYGYRWEIEVITFIINLGPHQCLDIQMYEEALSISRFMLPGP